MNCPICRTAMKPLFTSLYCPNECGKKNPVKVSPLFEKWKTAYPDLVALSTYGGYVTNVSITGNIIENLPPPGVEWSFICAAIIDLADAATPDTCEAMDLYHITMQARDYLESIGVEAVHIGVLSSRTMCNWHLKFK